MIQRPNYKEFLNQTRQIQSSAHLPNPDSIAYFPHAIDTSQNELRTQSNISQKPWESKYSEVVKQMPDNPQALRQTYARDKYPRTKTTFTSSYQGGSGKTSAESVTFAGASTYTYERPTYRNQAKEEEKQPLHSLTLSKCLTSKNLNASQKLIPSQGKSLYQSKSSVKLAIFRSEEDIQKQIQKLKELRNRRIEKNNNSIYRLEQKPSAEIEGSVMNRAPKSAAYITWLEEKENKEDTVVLQRGRCLDKSLKKKEKQKSPPREPISYATLSVIPPIQFRKKASQTVVERPIDRDVSPLKKGHHTVTAVPTSKHITETVTKPKQKSKGLCLQDFILGMKLGEGRFGVVWVAIHKLTGAIFALKKISKGTIKGNLMIDQFILQVKIQSFVDNQYVVKLYGIFDDSQSIYLLLEYLQGGTLYSQLKKKGKGKLQEEQASIKIGMVCQAVNSLHELGIAHRDIKPQNIIITNDVCKLCDFGWAACCDQRRMTYCGTTDYVAPEIVEGLQYDMSVDLWCIGVLVYELLSGRAPFYHISRQQTFNKIKNVDSSTLNYPEYFSQAAIDFIGKLIKKNPVERMDMGLALKHPFITKFQQ